MRQKSGFILIVHIFLLFASTAVHSNPQKNNELSLYPETIMRLTMDNSSRIKAARHKLESAQFNFKLFESEYTKFTPLKMNSKIRGDKNKEYESVTSLGIQKEFFDGSSMGASVGNSNIWGEGLPDENTQFIKTEVRFPLFSSNRKLNRIIKRTFEENELYSAQLDYVNTIRRIIRSALEMYYDYVPRAKTLQKFKQYKNDLIQLKNSTHLKGRLIEQQQLEGEINSLTSEIQGWEIEVQSLLINMKRWIGTTNFEKYSVKAIDLDFELDSYFGQYYLFAPFDDIMQKAIQNDTELIVLKLIQQNAVEKKRLAEKGKWDIFLSIEGQYNYREKINTTDYAPYYKATSGLEIKRFDKSILRNTIQKAEADIQYIQMTMKDRRIEMASNITQKKATLIIKKEQVLSSRKSLDSWQKIHDIKMDNFIKGTGTVDNYIQAFRSLIYTMEESLHHENKYMDAIRDFDYICGVYFQFLEIDAY